MTIIPPTPVPKPTDTPSVPPPGASRKAKRADQVLPGEILTVPHVVRSVTRTETTVTIVFTDDTTVTYGVTDGIMVID